MTIYYDIEQSPLFQENKGMLDEMLLDKQIFTLKHKAWANQEELIRKFWRS